MGPFDDLTEVQRQQIREAQGEATRRKAAVAHLTTVPAILGALNAYEKAHSPQAMAYDPDNIWRDIIWNLPGYDADRTDGFTDCDRFALADGTIIRWESGRSPLWQVDDPDDHECGLQDSTGEDKAR